MVATMYQFKTAEPVSKSDETAVYVEALQERYPNAVKRSEKLSEPARAAKNIRAELKVAFKGVKFTVTSKIYTGGSSISIHWTDGPTQKAVERIVDKYHQTNFDGMTDCSSYDNSALGNAVSVVLGRAGYVFAQRTVSCWDQVQADARTHYSDKPTGYELDRRTSEITQGAFFPTDFQYSGLTWNQDKHRTELKGVTYA